MENSTELQWLLMLLCISTASAIVAKEPEKEITTEPFDFPIQVTTESITETPGDNGMVIGDIPEQIPTNFPATLQGKVAEVEEEPEAVDPQSVLIAFPENHKNFTPSQYLGDQDYSPYYNQLNSYQEQYKNYYEQKKLFENRKPIKFEENSTHNFYLPPGLPQGVNPYAVTQDYGQKTKLATLNLKPFPYVFEHQRIPQNWYKNTGSGQIEVHEDRIPNSVLPDHGYQDISLPHYFFPQVNLQEHKFHKNEYYPRDHHHHHHQELTKDDNYGNPWKKVFKVLTALVPLGLFLATFTPNVITVNSSTVNPTPLRQRSEDDSRSKFKEEDVLKLLKEYGVDSLNESQCEDRVICELARTGMDSPANSIEKGFWYLANETPWEVAEKAGMNELFKAIKTGNCESFKCLPKTKSNAKPGFGKMLIRKRKIPQ